MNRLRSLSLAAACGLALLLAACGTAPPTAKAPTKEYFEMDLGDGFTLDYAIERTASRANAKACYAFITGSLRNDSGRTLSRKSVLDFIVMNRGKMLFRDITNPLADIPPGGSAAFEMVDSPVHKDGCPDYERIDINLRKVFLN